MTGTVLNRQDAPEKEITRRAPHAVRLALKVLLVGVVCHLSTQIGFAHKLPPHNLSALWPTNAIVFAVLLVTPIRHWWMYITAGYFTSVINDARSGFPLSNFLFLLGDLAEILIAALGVRRFADGVRAFESLRSLVAYILIAVLLAPFLSAFVAAFAGSRESYWFYWRVWFLSEGLAYLTLAPAIVTGIDAARHVSRKVSLGRVIEAILIAGGLLAVSIRVFFWPPVSETIVPALVYLPLPFLLWSAVRFGPPGTNVSLLMIVVLSISATVQGRGPFATSSPAENVLALQTFLLVISLPVMFLAALIGERRTRTNALRESEARFRSMADTAPVLIWMSGPDKLCTFLNKTWLDFTGRSRERELGNGWAEGIHPEERQRSFATYVDAFDARREFTMEYRLRRHDGEYRWVLDKGVPRYSPDGTFLGYIGCADDVSERKLAEAEAMQFRERLAHVVRVHTVGEMSAAITHEINQPLGAIENYALAARHRLATDGVVDTRKLDELLEKIGAQAARAGEVLKRLRSIVRKHESTETEFDLGEVVTETVKLVEMESRLRDVRVEIAAAPGPSRVAADEVQIQQVVLNLARNAIDAMDQSGLVDKVLRVEVQRLEELIVVRILDRGHGITADDRERIFEPFYSTKATGLGIGLSICRSIVEAYGGRLWHSPNPASGTIFQFTLPVADEKSST